MMNLEPVYLQTETGTVHVAARAGRGPILKSEQCNLQLDESSTTELKATELDAAEGKGATWCRVCGTPAFET